MAQFDAGETVICSCEVKNDEGTLIDPATSMTITIYNPVYTKVINTVAMTKDSTGKYHYDFQSSGNMAGKYSIEYWATDGTRISIEDETFNLEG